MQAVEALKRYLYISNGGERFELRSDDEAAVRRILLAIAAHPKPVAQMKDVLRLISALERRLESVTASERLRDWLRETPQLHPLIRRLGFSEVTGLDASRAFERREGRRVRLRAPQHGAPTPRGAVPLRDLLRSSSALRPPRRRSSKP